MKPEDLNPASHTATRDSEDRRGAFRLPSVLLLASIAIVLIGAGLRLFASWDDFWLDEIWSWRFAIAANSYWQIATQMRHDNNQIFNTWIIYSLPSDAHWPIYRFPAVLAGVGTVVLAGLCGLRRSPCECITALLLTSGSFVFIQYSSEARGYAYLLLFTMFCVWMMERVAVRPRARDEWLFGIGASLGFLAHFLFAAAYVGFLAWSLVSVLGIHRGLSARVLCLLKLHAIPFLTIAGLALSYGGQPITGGGDRQRLLDVLIQAGSLAVGGPDGGRLAELSCSGAILATIAGMILLFRRRDGVFYFVAGSTITLALMIWIAKPEAIYMRHFLIPVASIIVVLGHLLAQTWRFGMGGRMLYVVVMVAVLAGNGVHTWRLLATGRGGYQAAVDFMQAESKLPEITVASDHDFRNPMVLNYYYGRLTNPKPLVYFPRGRWPMEGPEWLILHSFQQPPRPLPEILDGAGNQYRLVRVYPYSGLSGWNWMIYQRVDLKSRAGTAADQD